MILDRPAGRERGDFRVWIFDLPLRRGAACGNLGKAGLHAGLPHTPPHPGCQSPLPPLTPLPVVRFDSLPVARFDSLPVARFDSLPVASIRCPLDGADLTGSIGESSFSGG